MKGTDSQGESAARRGLDNVKGQEVWGEENTARRGQRTCILAVDADADGAASLGLSAGPRTTLQDLGAFLPDHVAPNSLQGPDNTGEMTE